MCSKIFSGSRWVSKYPQGSDRHSDIFQASGEQPKILSVEKFEKLIDDQRGWMSSSSTKICQHPETSTWAPQQHTLYTMHSSWAARKYSVFAEEGEAKKRVPVEIFRIRHEESARHKGGEKSAHPKTGWSGGHVAIISTNAIHIKVPPCVPHHPNKMSNTISQRAEWKRQELLRRIEKEMGNRNNRASIRTVCMS